MKRRGKIMAFSTGAVGVLVLVAAGVAGRDWIFAEWYAYNLRSGTPEVRQSAIENLAGLRTENAAFILGSVLMKDAHRDLWTQTFRALDNLDDLAAEPLADALEAIATGPDPLMLIKGVEKVHERLVRIASVLEILLKLQIGNPLTLPLLRNIGINLKERDYRRLSFVDPDDWQHKRLVWFSSPIMIEDRTCIVFVLDPTFKSWPGSQPQTIAVTTARGELLTWKEVGGEPMFSSAAVERIGQRLPRDYLSRETATHSRGVHVPVEA